MRRMANKVITPKLRALALSQKDGQTDMLTNWNFQNDLQISSIYLPVYFLIFKSVKKNARKAFKMIWDGWTDGRRDGWTDRRIDRDRQAD